MSDRAVVAVIDAQRIVLGMTGCFEGGHEEHVLLSAAEHVVLGVEREDRRQGLPDEERRGGFIASDGVAGLAAFFADRVVRENLAAHLGDAGDGAKGEPMGFETGRVHADEQGEGGAGGVSADEDLAGVAAMFGDVLDRPGEGRGGVVDVGWIFRLRAETVVRSHDGDAGLGEALADLRAVFGTKVLGAVLQAAAVEPNVSGEALGAQRHGQVELATLLLVGRQ